VLSVDPDARSVTVGTEDELLNSELTARDVNWVANAAPDREIRARVKIRYRHAEADAVLAPLSGGRAGVRFDVPQRAVTPGQAAVFYDGDVCLGGGWIE
jgi:tRNA-specific 2-thiouridylase